MKDLTIFALSCAVVGLVLALLWRKAKESESAVTPPPDRDVLNMAEFETRQNQFAREIRLEKRA